MRFLGICLFLGICVTTFSSNANFKITVVIDAVSEIDFEESVHLVKESADNVFGRNENEILILDSDESYEELEKIRLTYEIVKALPEQINIPDAAADRDQNPLRVTSKKVCSEIMNGSVAVVLVHSPNDKSLASAISYALGFYWVPVISIASRDIEFSDKSVHSTFLRTSPPWSQQAEVWVALLEKLAYEKVILVYPDESNAEAMVALFRELIDNKKIEIDTSINYRPRHFDPHHLTEIDASDCNILLIYASPDDAYDIFRLYNKKVINGRIRVDRNRVLIANELALQANNTPTGLLTISLKATYERRMYLSAPGTLRKTFLMDALWALKHGIAKWYKWSIDNKISMQLPPKCDNLKNASPKSTLWSDILGKKLYSTLMATHQVKRQAHTLMAFDTNGDRKGAPYLILNVQKQKSLNQIRDDFAIVGEYFYDQDDGAMTLALNETSIVWGPNVSEKPKDFTLKTHLIVGTVADPPFIYAENITSNCHLRPNGPWRNCSKIDPETGIATQYCCRGLCIELLDYLANNNNTKFTYDLRLSSDNQYGAKQLDKTWTGLVGEIISSKIDMTVAALSINPERDEAIDFSKPWLYHGITILEKQKKRISPMESFMQPFQWQLWVCIFLSVIVIGIIMYGLDKLSPFGRFYVPKPRGGEEDDEHPLGFSGAMWFVWGVLLDSGIGERTPRSLSARVLGMVWCGFSMIMVASYTANLAAFLVLDQPQKSLTGITDTRLRNPNPNFTYATVKDSNVHMFFKRHVELSTIYRTMEGKNYEKPRDAVNDLKNNKLNAFIWDSTYLEYIASSECELQTSGELFGRSGYGIGLQKGSKWTSIITLAILHAHESGYMQHLDAKYITGVQPLACKQDDTAPVRLGLTNMRDLFILVAGGIALGFVFILFEILYKRRKGSKLKKRQLGIQYGRVWRQRSVNTGRTTTPRKQHEFTSPSAVQIPMPSQVLTKWRIPLPRASETPKNPYSFDDTTDPVEPSHGPPIWGRKEGPIELELKEMIENDNVFHDDAVEMEYDIANYGVVAMDDLTRRSSPQSHDERLAYRPRRAIIV